MKSFKVIIYIYLILQIYGISCYSAEPVVPFTLRPITPGPVSLSLGGASIVHHDDPLRAIQNPAKLPWINSPQFTLSIYSCVLKEISNLDNDHFTGTEGSNVREFKMNYLGLSCPFQLYSMNMAAALSYYPSYTFGRSIAFEQNDDNALTNKRLWHIHQDGYMSAVSIAYGIQFHSNGSFGISWNFFQDTLFDNQLQQETSMTGSQNSLKDFNENYNNNIFHEYSGNNLNLGLIWHVSSCLEAGAVLQTRLDHKVLSKTTETHGFNGNEPESRVISHTDNLEIPMFWGVGFSYSLIDNWKLLMDFRQISWEKLHYKNSTDTTQYIAGQTQPQALNVHMLHVGSVYQSSQRIGVYLPVFRFGLQYCTDRGMIHPEPDTAIGFGFGLKGKHVDFNFGYQYQRYDDYVQKTSEANTLRDRIRNNVIEMSLTYRLKNESSNL
jgi:opacity protein-like surface antigen